MLARGEEENGAGLWRADLYGAGEVLGGKRVRRGWDGGVGVRKWLDGLVVGGVEKGAGGGAGAEKNWAGVWGLLEWRGGRSGVEVYSGRLPWD